jgi:acetate---CoA ligase (ADP-forming)
VLEAMRDPGLLREVLALASARDIPVVLLTAGRSARGRAMVAAHSGALAGDDGAWEALAGAYGVHRVRDLAEMADTLEVFAAGRRVRGRPVPAAGGRPGTRPGIASVHDSGLERAHFADLADELGVPYAPLSEPVRQRLAGVLGPGLEPANPLDMWDGSEGSQSQVAQSLAAFASDPAVAVVGLAVDLVPEFDGDRSYPLAVLDAADRTSKPVVVITNIAAAVDQDAAGELRAAGIPVLEGARSGLLALRHLLDHAHRRAGPGAPGTAVADPARQRRWAAALAHGDVSGLSLLRLLRDYGITTARAREAVTASGALTAATEIGYPVVLKTAAPGIAHKSEVGGVVLGIGGPAALQRAYRELAARLGPRVLVCETAPPGTELAVGITRDPDLGPLLVAAAGGVLVEFLADRAVALPPVNPGQARDLLSGLRVSRLLEGVRGQPAAGLGAAAGAVASVSAIACELGEHLAALDINPLICGPAGAVAVDAFLLRRLPAPR